MENPPGIGRRRNFRAALQRRDQHVERRHQREDREERQEEIRPSQRPGAVAAHAAVFDLAGRRGLVDHDGAGHQASFPRLLMSRRMKIAAIARIGTMNSETLAPSGMSPPSMPIAERPGGENMGMVERTAGGQDAHDIEIGEGDDQRKQRRDRDDVAHHRQRHVPDALPPVGAVDGGGFIELIGHRFQRRQIHDHEERRADPDIDQDDREPRPAGVSPVHGIGPMPKKDSV